MPASSTGEAHELETEKQCRAHSKRGTRTQWVERQPLSAGARKCRRIVAAAARLGQLPQPASERYAAQGASQGIGCETLELEYVSRLMLATSDSLVACDTRCERHRLTNRRSGTASPVGRVLTALDGTPLGQLQRIITTVDAAGSTLPIETTTHFLTESDRSAVRVESVAS